MTSWCDIQPMNERLLKNTRDEYIDNGARLLLRHKLLNRTDVCTVAYDVLYFEVVLIPVLRVRCLLGRNRSKSNAFFHFCGTFTWKENGLRTCNLLLYIVRAWESDMMLRTMHIQYFEVTVYYECLSGTSPQ